MHYYLDPSDMPTFLWSFALQFLPFFRISCYIKAGLGECYKLAIASGVIVSCVLATRAALS